MVILIIMMKMVKALRERAKMSQEELATAANLGSTTIFAIEAKSAADLYDLLAIAKVFNMPLALFFENVGEDPDTILAQLDAFLRLPADERAQALAAAGVETP